MISLIRYPLLSIDIFYYLILLLIAARPQTRLLRRLSLQSSSCLGLMGVPPNINLKKQPFASKLAKSAFSNCCCPGS